MIRLRTVSLLLSTLWLCAACGTVGVVPTPTATALLDPTGTMLTEVHEDVAVTVRVDALSVQPDPVNENVAALHLVIDNRSSRPIAIARDAFVLKGLAGTQFPLLTPQRVLELVSRETAYLIPYPYVGYYYLEDQERYFADNRLTSSLPYYAEYHPQEILGRALPESPVLPGGRLSGVLYFLADLTAEGGAELLIFQDAGLQGSPRFRFPFLIAK